MTPNPYLVICIENGKPIYAEAYETSAEANARATELKQNPNPLDALVWEGVPDGEERPFYTEWWEES